MEPTRRRFLGTLSLAGAAGLLAGSRAVAADGPLETTTVRLPRIPGICLAPQYIAEELLRAEGFSEIRYVDAPSSAGFADAVSSGKVDFTQHYAAPLVVGIEGGGAITVMAGIHVGCLELLGGERVRTITDLKGKSVGVTGIGAADHLFAAVISAHIGLDPVKDISWVAGGLLKAAALFAEGKLDAIVASPPVPQDIRARRLGHVLANSALDSPWSQYFCCMLAGNRDFVRNHPVATKRVLRAFLKADDLCTTQPEWVARRLVDGGFTPRYDYALQALNEVPYDKWGEYEAEDTLRFYALRLRELGFIKSSPQKIIAEGADWRFFNELKRELKA